jgi:uncharacterized phage-associated protein
MIIFKLGYNKFTENKEKGLFNCVVVYLIGRFCQMPKDIITIAGAINTLYKKIYVNTHLENDMSEMKMHKLLYFAQKRHYLNFGEWLFKEDFEGWVHGPVNRKVRHMFDFLPNVNSTDLSFEEEYTIREIVHEYGKYSALYLRELSHKDNAYKLSRNGLAPHEKGEEIIKKVDIINDLANDQEKFLYQ